MTQGTRHKVLILGSDTYVGHNLGGHLKKKGCEVYQCKVRNPNSGVLRLLQDYIHRSPTAVVLLPVFVEPESADFFHEALKLCDENRIPRVILASWDGVTAKSESVGSLHFASLFHLEHHILHLNHAELAVVVRHGWLVEYFYWLAPHCLRWYSPLRTLTTTTLRPVAVMDVVCSLAALAMQSLSPLTPSQHHQQVYTVTGSDDTDGGSYRSMLAHLSALGLCENALSRFEGTAFLHDPLGVFSSTYERILGEVSKLSEQDFPVSPAPPLWPSNADLGFLDEFLRYATGEHHPADRATDHLKRIISEPSKLSTALTHINFNLKNLRL